MVLFRFFLCFKSTLQVGDQNVVMLLPVKLIARGPLEAAGNPISLQVRCAAKRACGEKKKTAPLLKYLK